MAIYKIPLYPTEHELTLVIEKTLSMTDETVKEMLDSELELEPLSPTTKAFSMNCVSYGERFFIIGITTKSLAAEILHEAIHVTWYLSEICGFNYKQDPELQCYLSEYLFNKIMAYKKPRR